MPDFPSQPYFNQRPQQQLKQSQTGGPNSLQANQAGGVTNQNSAGQPPVFSDPLAQVLFQQLSQLKPGMTTRENSLLLRAILSLPKDIKALLAMLATNGEQAAVSQFFQKTAGQKIPLAMIQNLLTTQSKDALGQLIKLIQQNQLATVSKESTNDLSQLKELLGLVSQLSGSASRSPAEALNTLMLLYIPYYPLAGEQKLNLSFGWQDEDAGKDFGEDPLLTLYLQTNNLGRFRIVVMEDGPLKLLFIVNHQPVAADYLSDIETQCTKAFKTDNLSAPDFVWKPFNTPEQSEIMVSEQAKPDKNADTQLTVVPSDGVSLTVINGGYQLAKILLEIDNRLVQL